jgi:hypothetical protein
LNERINHLLNNRRHYPKVFEFWVGYVVKLEYAPVRGWHAHTLFFFDGQEVRNDSCYSIEVGN